jgi:hypothetical protein
MDRQKWFHLLGERYVTKHRIDWHAYVEALETEIERLDGDLNSFNVLLRHIGRKLLLATGFKKDKDAKW